jgi:hypothetical protein
MTDHRFEYDESLLEDCARSGVAVQVAAAAANHLHGEASSPTTTTAKSGIASGKFDKESCVTLFELHAAHYGRQYTKEESLLKRLSTDLATASVVYEMGSRMQAFIANVVRVHEHNLALYNDSYHNYRLTLNRFADQVQLPTDRLVSDSFLRRTKLSTRRRPRRQRVLRQEEALPDPTVTLSTPQRILQVARDLRHGSKRATTNNKKPSPRNSNHVVLNQYPHPIRLPDADQEITGGVDDPFQTPTINTGMDGTMVSIKRQKSHFPRSQYVDDDQIGGPADTQSSLLPPTDEFAVSLNWATTNNPDGVALVHDPVDQVCRVCVAIHNCVMLPSVL